MVALTKRSEHQVRLPNIRPLFPPLAPTPSSGAMKKTATTAQAMTQYGLMKF